MCIVEIHQDQNLLRQPVFVRFLMFCFLIVGEFSLLTIGVDSRCLKSSSPELTEPTATDSIFQGEVLQRAIQYKRVESSLAMSGFDPSHLTRCLGSLLTVSSNNGGTTRWCSQDRCGPAPDHQRLPQAPRAGRLVSGSKSCKF